MKKLKVLLFFKLLFITAFSQQPQFSVVEYMPAPGQHINIENAGIPEAAQKIADSFNSSVSLGSFGGYIILKFDEACVNHPDNPYGIDFTVFGNAFDGSSEPGVIWVMKDENKNGLPDDTWYEIAGSHYFHLGTVQNYEVTYYKTGTRDVLWKDNFGKTGLIPANSFNPQEYYPEADYFPGYPSDSVTFTGTLLAPEINFSNSQEIKIKPPVFGYADSYPRRQEADLYEPDNPYTPEVEGAGGDPVDISWAVDSQGNYVELDSVHFVKIVSGTLAGAGWLGEVSTDVAWIEPVRQNPSVSGKENLLVVYPFPEKIIAGNQFQLEAAYFEKGRKTDAVLSYFSDNEQIADVDSDGFVSANNPGRVQLSVRAKNETEFVTVFVVVPENIQLQNDFSSVYPGDVIELQCVVLDSENERIDLPVKIASSDPGIAEINESEGKFFFEALRPGEIDLLLSVEGFDIQQQVTVKILSPDDKIRIYFTAKTSYENILPWQWIEADAANLSAFVENPQSDYSMLNKPTLFHALAAGLKQAGVPFKFRDDDAANGSLYLYTIENDGLFDYGWGGKTEPAAFAKAWIARHNNRQYLNGFQNIAVSDGDTVALYHVSDISKTWHYTLMLANKDSAAIEDEVVISIERASCRFNNGIISESAFSPVANTEIVAGKSFYTNAEGKALITVEEEPPLIVSSGNDALLISPKTVVGTKQLANSFISVFPNPVNDILNIELNSNQFKPAVLKLFSPEGRIIFEENIHSVSHKLDFSSFPAGVYYLVFIQDNKTETCKILKR